MKCSKCSNSYYVMCVIMKGLLTGQTHVARDLKPSFEAVPRDRESRIILYYHHNISYSLVHINDVIMCFYSLYELMLFNL